MSAININKAEIKKILLCQQRQIGDVVTATPVITLAHEAFPHAEIHFLTEAKCTPIVDNNPYITKTWSIDKDALSTIWKRTQFYHKIWKEHFDIVVDFQQLPRLRTATFFSQAPIRLAAQGKWYNRALYTHTYPQKDGYVAISKASILESLGIHWNGQRPCMFLRDAERQEAQERLRAMGITPQHHCISLDVSHKDMNRAWSQRHYARLIDMAYEADPMVRFVAFWGPGEERYVRDMAAMCQHQDAVRVIPELFSLRIVAACIEASCMHVGNCSAPRHMAVALGTPTFTLRADHSTSWTYPSPEHVQTEAWVHHDGAVSESWHASFTAEMAYPVFAEHFLNYKKTA
ncbi:MAG: glycosyltransferase family 9 protein [Pseudomonadota bacterium]